MKFFSTKKKSRKELGDEIGVCYQQIQNYETGKHRVSAQTLLKIAETLDIPIEKFYYPVDEFYQ